MLFVLSFSIFMYTTGYCCCLQKKGVCVCECEWRLLLNKYFWNKNFGVHTIFATAIMQELQKPCEAACIFNGNWTRQSKGSVCILYLLFIFAQFQVLQCAKNYSPFFVNIDRFNNSHSKQLVLVHAKQMFKLYGGKI